MTLALLAAAMQVGEAAPEASSDVPRVAWEQVLGSDEYWYSLESAAGSEYGEVILGGLAREDRVPGRPLTNHPVVWRLDARGEVLCEFLVETPESDPDGRALEANLCENVLVALLDGGDALLSVNFEEGRPWLVRLDTAGRSLFARPLLDPERNVRLTEMSPAGSAGRFLLTGSEGSAGVLLCVDANGELLWEAGASTDAAFGALLDTVPTDDGLLAVQNVSLGNPLQPGDSSIRLRRYDMDGKPLGARAFAGRHGSLSRDGGGRRYLVYDAGTDWTQRVRVVGLDGESGERWRADLFEGEQELYTFRAAPAGDDGVFVAGGRARKPLVARYDASGRRVWSRWFDEMQVAPEYQLVGLDADHALVACTTYVRTVSGEVKGKVRCFAVGGPQVSGESK